MDDKTAFQHIKYFEEETWQGTGMIKAAINHVLDDVCTQTGCIKRANVCT